MKISSPKTVKKLHQLLSEMIENGYEDYEISIETFNACYPLESIHINEENKWVYLVAFNYIPD